MGLLLYELDVLLGLLVIWWTFSRRARRRAMVVAL